MDLAIDTLGNEASAKLKSRLADLRVLKSVKDIPVGYPTEILFNNKPCYQITLAEGYILRFSANHNKIPTNPDDTVDWSKITRIQILSIDQDE